jgi:adenylosuccinate synthase
VKHDNHGLGPGQVYTALLDTVRMRAYRAMMRTGFNVVLDAQHGSSGKGKLCAFLADAFKIRYASAANFPNAGHTVVLDDGAPFVAKVLPAVAALSNIGQRIECYLSPGSGFSWHRLAEEVRSAGNPLVYIHERASVVSPEHAARERAETSHIASTMQGSGAALSDKIRRLPSVMLAGNTIPPEPMDRVHVLAGREFRNRFYEKLSHAIWLHEGAQGFALSIDHGSHYPQCTSRNCTLQAAMDFMACPPAYLGDVWVNVRPFPIRVGNLVVDGHTAGYSGDGYPDQDEITWDMIAQEAGMPAEERHALTQRELTTVTKRLRRVFSFSWDGFREACRVNGATKIALNFAQYIDWKAAGLRGDSFACLPSRVRLFIDKLETCAGVPVVCVGTGARHSDMVVNANAL